MNRRLRVATLTLLCWTWASAPAQEPAQPPRDAVHAALHEAAARVLTQFGKRAEGQKSPARARRAYELVLRDYDPDHAVARRALGFRRQGDHWLPPEGGTAAGADAPNPRQRSTVERAWREAAAQLAALHRDCGITLLAAGQEDAGRQHLLRALQFDPDDAKSHAALGHGSIDDFHGDERQLATVRRMREILAEARRLRDTTYPVETLSADDAPAELRATGLTFFGAKSAHFTQWNVDSAAAAAQSLQWAERCRDLLRFLLGDQDQHFQDGAIRWRCTLRTDAQRDLLLERCPAARGELTVEQARRFGGTCFEATDGDASIWWHAPKLDADYSVAEVTKRFLVQEGNTGFGEGLVHATTWLLCGSAWCWFTALPGTISGEFQPLDHDPKDWMSRLQDQIEAGTDRPLVQVARERADHFRDDTRVKAWSAMSFVLARYPDSWHRLLRHVDADETPEAIAEQIEEAIGDPAEQVEQELRAFVRRGSSIGRASHWP